MSLLGGTELTCERGTQGQAIGRSRGGITTKILALTDALGNLVDFRLLPGQAHDLREVPELIDDLASDHLLADRAFDADWLRTTLVEQSITPVIPPKSNRHFPAEFDKDTYKWRHLIETISESSRKTEVSLCDRAKQTRASRRSSHWQPQSFNSDERLNVNRP